MAPLGNAAGGIHQNLLKFPAESCTTSLLGNREKGPQDRGLNGSMDLQLRYQGSAQAGDKKIREKVVSSGVGSGVKRRKPVGQIKKKKSIQSTDFS